MFSRRYTVTSAQEAGNIEDGFSSSDDYHVVAAAAESDTYMAFLCIATSPTNNSHV